jgi:hypothetical protein
LQASGFPGFTRAINSFAQARLPLDLKEAKALLEELA